MTVNRCFGKTWNFSIGNLHCIFQLRFKAAVSRSIDNSDTRLKILKSF